jgi:hypothetical protein
MTLATPSLPARPEASQASVAHLHAHFLSILPRIEAHARSRFRHLRCPGRREDAIAEVIAVAWKWYLRLSERGKDVNEFVSTFADYAVRHVRSGRRVCGRERAGEVLSPHTQQVKKFRVECLPRSSQRLHEAVHGVPHGQREANAFEERLRDNTVTPPDEQAAFRLDYPVWLARLGPRDRDIVGDMTLDLGTDELASRHRVSPGRISQLRRSSARPGFTSKANPSPAESPTRHVSA